MVTDQSYRNECNAPRDEVILKSEPISDDDFDDDGEDDDQQPFVQDIKHEPEIILEEDQDSKHLSSAGDEPSGSEMSFETYSIKFFDNVPATIDEKRARRMEYNRLYNRQCRGNETPEQRAQRLEKLRKKRASETPEQRARRLECMRQQNEINRQLRLAETSEQRRLRLEKLKQHLANEDAEQRAKRLEQRRARMQKYRAKETPEERERRLEYNRQYALRYGKRIRKKKSDPKGGDPIKLFKMIS